LAEQQLALGLDLRRGRSFWGVEIGKRIVAPSRRRPQSCHIESCGNEVRLEMILFGGRHGRIEFDETLPGGDVLPVTHVNGSNDTSLEWLHEFGPAAWD
jgi:hypothetical protein